MKNVMITGATSGIGRETTKKLLEAGYNVAFCGRSEEKLQKVINENRSSAGKQYYMTFDVRDVAEISTFIDESVAAIGEIDILINCAGLNSERATVESISVSELKKMIDVNLIAPFNFIQKVYGDMKKREDGLIINILSTVCNFSNEGLASYTASKAGFEAMVKVLRKEARNHNVKVSSVYPGGVDTEFREASRPQYLSVDVVADSIMSLIKLSENSCMDELVIRPMVEKNYS